MKIIVNKFEFADIVRMCAKIQMLNAGNENLPPCAGCLVEGVCENGIEDVCEVVEDETDT